MKKGFTLIEIMMVLSIISVLGTVSLYGVRQLIEQNYLHNTISLLSSSLTAAQSNSRSSGFTTVICSSADSARCDKTSNWSNGWIIYTDVNDSHTLDNSEAVIYVVNGINDDVSIALKALGDPQKIIFYRDGRLWPNGSFSVCHAKFHRGQRIIMFQSGRIRTAEISDFDC